MKPNKQVIGLTGTIASGKSTAAAYFHEKYGVPVIDADKVGHEVLEDPRIIGQLTEAFGDDILVHGRIDRKKLGNKVFDDPASLERLNGITHPEICRRVHETAEAFRKSDDPAPFMLIEAYGLLQSDLKKDADAVWAVGCDKRLRCRRIMERQGLTEEEARARIQGQWPDEKYRELADVYFDGSGTADLLQAQCDVVMQRFL